MAPSVPEGEDPADPLPLVLLAVVIVAGIAGAVVWILRQRADLRIAVDRVRSILCEVREEGRTEGFAEGYVTGMSRPLD